MLKGYYALVTELPAEDGGGYLVEIPDLPGCMADGDTPQAALQDAAGAIDEWIDAAIKLGRPVPKPKAVEQYSGKWLQRVPKSLHMRLALKARKEGTSLNALATAILAEGVGRR